MAKLSDIIANMDLSNEHGGGRITPGKRWSKEQERLEDFQQEDTQLELLYKDVELLRKERDHYRRTLEKIATPGMGYGYWEAKAALEKIE